MKSWGWAGQCCRQRPVIWQAGDPRTHGWDAQVIQRLTTIWHWGAEGRDVIYCRVGCRRTNSPNDGACPQGSCLDASQLCAYRLHPLATSQKRTGCTQLEECGSRPCACRISGRTNLPSQLGTFLSYNKISSAKCVSEVTLGEKFRICLYFNSTMFSFV